MNEKMEFPNTFEEFVNEYSFKDSDEVYTNGSDLIQTFRAMQGWEHFVEQISEDEIRKFLTWLTSEGFFDCYKCPVNVCFYDKNAKCVDELIKKYKEQEE